jgi:hypothetical protein
MRPWRQTRGLPLGERVLEIEDAEFLSRRSDQGVGGDNRNHAGCRSRRIFEADGVACAYRLVVSISLWPSILPTTFFAWTTLHCPQSK